MSQPLNFECYTRLTAHRVFSYNLVTKVVNLSKLSTQSIPNYNQTTIIDITQPVADFEILSI